MKTIGLLGGMSWESTVPYYQHINQLVRERLGGLHSAKVVLYSVDFHEIAQLQRAGNWDEAQAVLSCAAKALVAAGAEILVICTNTMHKLAAQIEAAAGIPLLHIAMPTATAIQQAGLRKVGLMGTRFTMEQPFYRDLLQEKYGLELVIPEEAERADIHRVIFDELCVGEVREESRQRYHQIMANLVARGAEGIILGCTEIAMLVSSDAASVPLFDTTTLHARGAVELALA